LLVFVYLVLLPLGSSAIALFADRAARPGLLWRTALTLGLLLAAEGFVAHRIDLQRRGYTESSGMTPIALGLAVPLITTSVVRASRGWPAPLRVAMAAVVAALATPPLALLSHYVLSALVPDFIGCCPL
jgi:hypothetical protein